MGKGSGSSRNIDKTHKKESALKDGLDDWDGSVLHGQGNIDIRLGTVANELAKGSKKKNDAIAVRDAILKDMTNRGFPLDVIGSVTIAIGPKGSITGEGGHSVNDSIEVIVSSSTENAIRTAYHEIGHQIHDKYFPKWSQGDVMYDASDKQSTKYHKSAKEAFANRFRDEVLKRSKIKNIASIIRKVKKSVDDDVANGKLNPIDIESWKAAYSKVNASRPRAHLLKRTSGIGYDKVYIEKKIKKVQGGKIVVVAKSGGV